MKPLLSSAVIAAALSLPTLAYADCTPTLCPPNARYTLVLFELLNSGATMAVVPGRYNGKAACEVAGRTYVVNPNFDSFRCIRAPSLD